MATAVANSYTVAPGQPVNAGRFGTVFSGAAALDDLGASGAIGNALPSWYAAANTNEWVDLPNSTLTTSGVGWSGASPGGNGNYTSVVIAWGGGILNTVGVTIGGAFVAGTFMVIFGGGHGDYAGNELYAYGPLEANSPTWNRLTNPSIPAPNGVARLNGYPVSRHTYDTLVYLPTVNKMLCIGAPGYYQGGSNFNVSDIFDFAVNPASANPWSTNDTAFPAFGGGGTGTINLLSAYNSTTGKSWSLGSGNGQALGAYDVASGTWSSTSHDNAQSAANRKAAIDPTRNLFVFQGTAGAVRVLNLASPTTPIYSPTVTGTGPADGNNVLDWDAAGNRFVAWDLVAKTIYFLTPGANPASGGDAWVWTSATPAGGATPAAATGNGTYGRFRMNNSALRGIVLMPTAANSMCFYKF